MIFVQENLPVPVAVRPHGVREEVQLEPQLVQVLPLQTGDVQPLLQKLCQVIISGNISHDNPLLLQIRHRPAQDPLLRDQQVRLQLPGQDDQADKE